MNHLDMHRQVAADVLDDPSLAIAALPLVDEMNPPYAQIVKYTCEAIADGQITDNRPKFWLLLDKFRAAGIPMDTQQLPEIAIQGMPFLFADHLNELRLEVAADRLRSSLTGALGMDGSPYRRVADVVAEGMAHAEDALCGMVDESVSGDEIWDYVETPDEWAIPDLVRRENRIVFTGYEGQGKSVLLRQFAIGGAMGIHPFRTHEEIDPIRTMIIDVENADQNVRASMNQMLCTLRDRRNIGDRESFNDRFRFSVMDGCDVLNKADDRHKIETLVKNHRPELLVIGPVYRMTASGGNLDEEQAQGVLNFINYIRSKYGTAIMLEAHTSKGQGGTAAPNTQRGLDPSGSAVWMRFPEVGRGIRQDDKASDHFDRPIFRMTHFRGDRMPVRFPRYISRAPWPGVWWDDFTEEAEALG